MPKRTTRGRGPGTGAGASNTPPPSPPVPVAHFSAGRYTTIEDGAVRGDYLLRERMMAIKARSLKRNAAKMSKTAGLFNDGDLGPANIADSNNIGYYSYEFPVDSLEMPQSRPEELRFYRLAYDRDPIVGRAIDLHTELPLSKMQLEKPKCSVESFADYVFDYFQRLVNDTQMFQLLIEATREYHTIGEAFLYIIQPDDFRELEITPETLAALQKGRGFSAGISPGTEATNAPLSGQEDLITDDWIHSRKQSSKIFKQAAAEKLFDQFTEQGIGFEDDDKLEDLKQEIKAAKVLLLAAIRDRKTDRKTASKRKKVAATQAPVREGETKLLAAPKPVTETPAFKVWFHGSVVVNPDGTPMLVYHGSPKDFDTFDTEAHELGSHFGTSPEQANHANENKGGSGRNTKLCYLSIKRPLRLQDRGLFTDQYLAGQLLDLGIITRLEWQEFKVPHEPGTNAKIKAAIEAAGYDGIVYLNRQEAVGAADYGEDYEKGDESEWDDESFRGKAPDAKDSWIAFHPNQIKSAIGNSGAFDSEQSSMMASLRKTAAPGDPPPAPGGDAPAGDAAPDAGGEVPEGGLEGGPGGEGAPEDMGGSDGDLGGGFGGGGGGGGGGGFGGGGMEPDPSQIDGAEAGMALEADAERQEEISDLKRYLHLLERKKGLLEELKDLMANKQAEKEIFSHVVNKEYEGFERIQMLAPEKIELANDDAMGPEPQVMYKPTDQEKLALLENEGLDQDTREVLEEKGQMRLNTNPFKGPFVIHFARKKAGYELHGRSVLQRCMRTIIYREKLRQVQTTLASRNMTPKTVITAPGVSEIQVAELRAHADEAKADPDYTIVTNYELTWNEISSQGRLLTLGDEYQHLNSDIAIGLGFSPEILIGEGLYGGNRIQLELLNTTYTQFRESLTDVIENKIFKPLAQLKGFFETDNYGRPRWIYPKITFGRMALRDSGDLFEMLFNLYSKGSLPVATILEFLNIDAETVKRQLEDDLFTVNDSKFNELLSNVYANVAQAIVDRTDVVSKLTKGMMLTEKEDAGPEMEGSGEGL